MRIAVVVYKAFHLAICERGELEKKKRTVSAPAGRSESVEMSVVHREERTEVQESEHIAHSVGGSFV